MIDRTGYLSLDQVSDALREASTKGNEKLVKFILNSKFDMKPYQSAALTSAALSGHTGIVDLLLEYESVSRPSHEDSVVGSVESIGTILIAGCRGAHAPVVARARELLSLGFSPPKAKKLRKMALDAALQHNNGNIIRTLLDCGFEMEADELVEAFASACKFGHAAVLLDLLDSAICITIDDSQYCTALKEAAKNGHSDVVRLLYRRDSSRYSHEILEQTFVVSCSRGLTDVAREMLGEVRGSSSQHVALALALNCACLNGHERTVAFLIQEGANINAVEAETQHLFQEVFTGNAFDFNNLNAEIEDVYNLIPEIEAKDIKGSPLQCALRGFGRQEWYAWTPYTSGRQTSLVEREAIILLLLRKNAKVNTPAELQDYPIHLAIRDAPPNVIRAMVAEGAIHHSHAERWMFSHLPNNRKVSIFEMAAMRKLRGLEVIDILIERGAMAVMGPSVTESALDRALKVFGGTSFDSGFSSCISLEEDLEEGPGAVIRALLPYHPDSKADDVCYGLLLQMAARAGDRGCVEVLLRHHINVNSLGYYYGTALQAASRVGNIDVVQMLLDAHADVNLLQGKYGTALRAAVKGEHLLVVELLLRHGADVNLCLLERESDINTEASLPILNLAIQQGSNAIARVLLTKGADLNAPDDTSWAVRSPLQVACGKGYGSLAAMLLAHGADIEKGTREFRTPLQLAASAGHVSVVQLLLEAGAKVDSFTNEHVGTALSMASANGHRAVTTILIKEGASIGGPPDIPNALAAACRQRHRAIVELMLEELFGTKHEESICREALAAACAIHDDATAQVLLEHVQPWSSATLHQVCAAGLEASLTRMIKKGVNLRVVDDNGSEVIHTAASHLKSGVVRLLIKHGADVNEQKSHHGSPLIAALEGCLAPRIQNTPEHGWLKHIETIRPHRFTRYGGYRNPIYNHNDVVQCRLIVQSLLGEGAVAIEEMRVFGAAIHLASFIGDEEIVRLLVMKGLNINLVGGFFETPLLAAVAGRNITVTKLLLDYGAEINYVSSKHATALHLACSHDLKPIVRILVDYGADVNAQIDELGTPLSVALWYDIRVRSSWNHESLTKVLLDCGRRIKIQESDLQAIIRWQQRVDDYLKLLLDYDPSINNLVETLLM